MRLAVAVRLALVLYAAVEVALFVLVGQWLGGGALFLWILATAAVGVVLIRREGMRAVETMRVAMRERQAPEPSVPDRGFVAFGAPADSARHPHRRRRSDHGDTGEPADRAMVACRTGSGPGQPGWRSHRRSTHRAGAQTDTRPDHPR